MIHYDGENIVTDKTEKTDVELTSVVILGSVSCGIPQLEEERAEGRFHGIKANINKIIREEKQWQ